MINDLYFKKIIISYYMDNKKNIFQINIFDKQNKTNYVLKNKIVINNFIKKYLYNII